LGKQYSKKAATPAVRKSAALTQPILLKGVAMTLHTIHFMKPINGESLNGLQNVCLSALNNGASRIRIYISSSGGSTDVGFTAYNFIRSLPVPVDMHCIGNIESIAVVLFLAGEQRLTVKDAKFKIHPLHWGFNAGTVDHDRLKEYSESLDFDANLYASIFEERTNGAETPINVREHLMGKALIIDSATALINGLATAVEPASIPAAATKWWV